MIGERLASGGGNGTAVGRGLLLRYRAMAFTTGILLIVLVFVGIPLQVWAHRPALMTDVGTAHGYLYIAYLLFAFQLTQRLGRPKWQMLLVLLAGTVPLCGFVAERRVTKWVGAHQEVVGVPRQQRHVDRSIGAKAVRVRQRWLSRRAILFHIEVTVVAGGCGLAGWWQAQRALAGHGLSWFYAVEWPVFGILAIVGWWYLIHEDPEAYRARKEAPRDDLGLVAHGEGRRPATIDRTTARLAMALGGLTAAELVLGLVSWIVVPLAGSTGAPTRWAPLYLAHVIVAMPLAIGAVVLLARVWRSTRFARLAGVIGAAGVLLANGGGVLTASPPLRMVGMGVMMLGALTAGFGYMIPALEKLS